MAELKMPYSRARGRARPSPPSKPFGFATHLSEVPENRYYSKFPYSISVALRNQQEVVIVFGKP